MKIYYIGSFPPTYGGVTIKNNNLYEALLNRLNICRIDMNRIKRGDIWEIVRFGWAMLVGRQYIIGLAGPQNRCHFTKLMYRFKRKAMCRSVMLVMGGVVEDIIQSGATYISMISQYRHIYLELPKMARDLSEAGVSNAAVYPNGRHRPKVLASINPCDNILRCVFFSQIEPDKGVDCILEAAALLPDIQFDFYGSVVPEYEGNFFNEIDRMTNVHYHGVFTGNSEMVYKELNQYDVLLLPTRCKTEGLPGILVEAKIAGLASIVSAVNHNREIVCDGLDGIVLNENTVECLVASLKKLDNDHNLLLRMKSAASKNAENYYIDVCAQKIFDDLEKG